jgi:phenylalanine ammonia-lyase
MVSNVHWLSCRISCLTIYPGINTGYGGSADTRSSDFVSMQRALIQHQNSGVLLPSDIGQTSDDFDESSLDLKSHNLPRPIVRGTMLARINSLLRGHSAVRLVVVENIATLLNHDFVPVIPLRGSISASGDLSPLSYIAGALEGNHDIFLDCRMPNGKRQIMSADRAIQLAGLTPTTMMPKEGLGLMNGTAVSVAGATMALHETQYLALSTQVLTAMCTEAMRGSADNYHPFIADIRPHAGQMEAGINIFKMLETSKLVVGKDSHTAGLYQDRYALRTSSQWIGPQLEDLMLSAKQLEVELNSTTDNPLVDPEAGMVHHGGNFQAASVTSAMEKTRLSLQMLGKLMFAQCTELINPQLNHILSPNLCFDDPDLSYTFKGIDINMASYQSELAFLANPVSTHVQSAEMHNQAVNSLALISARYTLDAVELVSLMTSAFLYALCQALDLHVLYIEYMTLIEKKARPAFEDKFSSVLSANDLAELWPQLFTAVKAGLTSAKSKALDERSRIAAEATLVPLTKALAKSPKAAEANVFTSLIPWSDELATIISSSVRETRVRFSSGEGPTTLEYLGHGSATMYRFVRYELNVPLHKGLVEHPTYPNAERDGVRASAGEKVTLGKRISTIYGALRTGRMRKVLLECLA